MHKEKAWVEDTWAGNTLSIVPIKDIKTQIHKENKYKDIYHSKLLDIS